MPGTGITGRQDTLSRHENVSHLYGTQTVSRKEPIPIKGPGLRGDTMVSIQQQLNKRGWHRIQLLMLRMLSEERLLVIFQVGKRMFVAILAQPLRLLGVIPKWFYFKGMPAIFHFGQVTFAKVGKQLANWRRAAVSTLRKPIESVQRGAMSIQATLIKAYSALKTPLLAATKWATMHAQTFAKTALSWAQNGSEKVQKMAHSTLATLQQPIKWAQPTFQRAFHRAAEIAKLGLERTQRMAQYLQSGFQNISQTTQTLITTLAQPAINLFQNMAHNATNQAKRGAELVQNIWAKTSATANTITQALMSTAHVAWNHFLNLQQKCIAWSKPQLAKMKEQIKRMLQFAKDLGSSLYHQAKKGLKKAQTHIKQKWVPLLIKSGIWLWKALFSLLIWIKNSFIQFLRFLWKKSASLIDRFAEIG